MFDNVQRAISFNQRNKAVDKMPIVAKKKLLRKKFKQRFMSALQKNKSTQSSGSEFAERNERVKKTKFELKLIKIVDSFLDGRGIYDNNFVSLKKKSLSKQYFFVTVSKSNECSQRRQMTCYK